MTARDHARAERADRRDEVPTQEVAVNAYRTDGALVLVAPMPGVTASDVEIRIDGPEVRLSAALRSDAPKDYVLHEWDYGAYERTLDVGDDYGEPIVATLGNGQLVVSLARGGTRATGPVVVRPTPKPE
ncbi:MAG TPA: Hsp20/alpha crystallin family protein [Acidimicrobiales bacterium]|nr:Hsp20/alpha crystallin family protein [Acidimicrobiales bacterium]